MQIYILSRNSAAYFESANWAVALETKNTNAGLNFFPPAPNICSAADIKTGFSAPTICWNIYQLCIWWLKIDGLTIFQSLKGKNKWFYKHKERSN